MSRIRGKLAIIRDNVGKILDVQKRGEEMPEKVVAGQFASVKFPVIKRGIIDDQGNVIPQSEEDKPDQ
ncbi:hypothetical protein LCGC14_1140210 [marine sediment metagenome]|uniref:Uncharacterized protein n=1 Tax=marine sediment metagenome TaxID=412755 RepID=A0A0F9LYF0_9ZZZZ